MIKEDLLEFAEAYPEAKKKYVRARPIMPEIEVPLEGVVKQLKDVASISRPYGIKGSVGENNLYMPECPWIGVFDTNITPMSAQKGYYIVYLFSTDMKHVFLSLNQGYTQYQNLYTRKHGHRKVRENANIAGSLLRGKFEFKTGEIDLGAKNNLAKGYEAGSICSKLYSIDNLPRDDVFARDLNNMIGLYRELKGIIGNDILRIEDFEYLITDEVDEIDFQVKVQEPAEPYDADDGPVNKPEEKNAKGSTSYKRDPNVSKEALRRAGYKCEINPSHTTFIVKAGHQFVEAHHLIPMAAQDDFEYSLDVPENVVALCPNCHRKIHHGILEDKLTLFKSLFKMRKEILNNRGILIDESEIKRFLV